MSHNIPLITTLASAFGLALLLGFIAVRLRLPPLVGYLCAGVFIGPFTPGFIANAQIASELAEIGVMLLMFGVGLHFSLEDLLDVRKISIPGGILQITLSTLLGAGLALLWGWPLGQAMVFGLCLSVASTVVLLRALEAHGILETQNGRIIVGWLVVQDLVMVFVLVLLPPLAGWISGDVASIDRQVLLSILLTLGKVALFIGLMLLVGRRLFPKLLWYVASTGSRELFTLCVVAAAVGIAVGAAKLFGVSFALGAFFAGMVLRESEFSHRAAEESLPLREAFAVLFFVSVGMLFDPAILVEQPLQVLSILALIMLLNPLAAGALVLLFRYPLNTALTMVAGLAQIGEFSFILYSLGSSLGLLPAEGQSLVLAAALISIAINPVYFSCLKPLQTWLHTRSALATKLDQPASPLAELPMTTDRNKLSGQVVLVGYGRVGRRISLSLAEHGIPFVVVEENREQVEKLRKAGIAAIQGNAAEPKVLIQAHIAHASMLVAAIPDAVAIRQMIATARSLNARIDFVVRTHDEEEANLLQAETPSTVFFGEAELARGMSNHVLEKFRTSLAT